MSKASSDSEFINLPAERNSAGLLVRTCVVPADVLAAHGLDARATLVEIDAGSELYQMVTSYLVEHGSARSFKLDIGKGQRSGPSCCDSDSDGEADEACRVATKDLGLGRFDFAFEDTSKSASEDKSKSASVQMHALHMTLGDVVGTNCGPSLMKSLILMASCEDAVDVITRFCDALIAQADTTSASTFSIYRWHVQYSYWRKAEVVKARPIESVVLDAGVKDKVVDDMAEFISPSTRAWYAEHGVPYKRSFLLHGAPGAGKTSLIAALAGRFKRNVCYFSSLSHPEMTDDNLKAAVQRVPAKSILVLEDVDALFDEADGRKKRGGDKSALTFSGVLNALDGVGASTGQIFVLTTNHRERLDPALIRCGRVDVHVEFKDASAEQMRLLFRQFYKEAPASLAEQFESKLTALLGGKTVSMAQLQHYFTMQRRQPAEVAAEQVHKVLEEAAAHGLELAKSKEDKEDKEKKKDAQEEEGEEGKDKEAGGGRGRGGGRGGKGGRGGGRGGGKPRKAAKAEEEEDDEDDEEEDAAKPSRKGKGGGGGGKEVHVHLHID